MADTERNKNILAMRPSLALPTPEVQSPEELFQNSVLRPILKLQHPLLIHRFVTDSFTVKQKFAIKNAVEKTAYIEHRLKTDKKLQKEYVGMITGLMTLEEYTGYLQQKSELDRRITSMLVKRIIDGTKNDDHLPKVF